MATYEEYCKRRGIPYTPKPAPEPIVVEVKEKAPAKKAKPKKAPAKKPAAKKAPAKKKTSAAKSKAKAKA